MIATVAPPGASSPLTFPTAASFSGDAEDPFRAAELLLLPGGPLPGHARRALLDALSAMPGVGSPKWRAAIERAVAAEAAQAAAEGIAPSTSAAAGAALRERIADWFEGELHCPVAGIPTPAALLRLSAEPPCSVNSRPHSYARQGDVIEPSRRIYYHWPCSAAVVASRDSAPTRISRYASFQTRSSFR